VFQVVVCVLGAVQGAVARCTAYKRTGRTLFRSTTISVRRDLILSSCGVAVSFVWLVDRSVLLRSECVINFYSSPTIVRVISTLMRCFLFVFF